MREKISIYGDNVNLLYVHVHLSSESFRIDVEYCSYKFRRQTVVRRKHNFNNPLEEKLSDLINKKKSGHRSS